MIEAAALSRAFHGRAVPAVDRVSFSIGTGEIVALAGRNGAGKTTLLDVLSTLLLPSHGTASVAGFDITREAGAVRRQAAYAMAGPRGLFTRLSGRRNLEFYGALHPGIPDVRARIDELIATFELDAFIDRPVWNCSDGMQQKLVLARTLLGRPSVLLLDEPMRALDPVARRRVLGIIEGLLAEGSLAAVLYATHDLDERSTAASRTLVLSRGRLIFDGVPAAGQIAALLDAEERA
ncbi:MAG: ABC transporter ATP-binding protein [Acidobacteriota bacterium]|nr:ABC transporter ATP-binding protein [Acidobacteriota bacterium]